MPSQTHRIATVITPLGEDVLLFHRMVGHEEMGRLFRFEVEMLSEREVDINAFLGQPVTVSLENRREFSGIVSEFKKLGTEGEFFRYCAILRPWLWVLTRKSNCRIYQNKNIPTIIKEVFRDHGFSDFQEKLSGAYEPWDYCVQYRESDFDFVSRLMEHEGIYYYFEHRGHQHFLILADSINAHSPVAGYEKITYFPPENIGQREEEHIYEWHNHYEMETGNYMLNDFDFESPSADLKTKAANPKGHRHDSKESYDYPGKYTKVNVGQSYTDIRLEELQTPFAVVSGRGDAAGLVPGTKFLLEDHYFEQNNVEHIVVSADYELISDEYRSGGRSYVGFDCGFTAIKASQQFRTARTTPKPVIAGPQTAIVVGPSGEEIWTDNYGRVKVQFHWDRDGKRDENSSCWIRVSHPMAGKNWGWISLPRIGQEVIVEFLEGDPDRPIITGRVYNAEQMPPYALPENQTRSGMKSRSSKQGSGENFNEIRFEDKKGEEELYIHAEKDLNCVVENDETRKIGFDKMDSGNQTIDIYNDRTVTLEMGNDALTIKTGNHTVNINSGRSTTEAMQSIELIVGANSIKIDQGGITLKGIKISIEGSATCDVKSPMTTVKGDGILTLQGGLTKIN